MTDYTIIPSRIDASAVDNKTIDVDGTSKLRIRPAYDTDINTNIALCEIGIIELQANASITPIDHDTLITDTFSDSDGYKNTVSTGTTTATYDAGAKKYKRVGASGGTDSHTWQTMNSTGTETQKEGFRISAVQNCNIVSFTKHASCTATKGYLEDASHTVLTSATFSGDVCTFPTPYAITTGTTYFLTLDNNGSNFTNRYTGGTTYPSAKTYISWTGGLYHGAIDPSDAFDILNATFSIGTNTTQIVVITLPTISGTVTHTELVCNCPDRETGDAVTYKLKNATQSDDTLALNTKNALTNLTTNPTGIEIQLVPKSGSPTTGKPSAKSYALKLWKA